MGIGFVKLIDGNQPENIQSMVTGGIQTANLLVAEPVRRPLDHDDPTCIKHVIFFENIFTTILFLWKKLFLPNLTLVFLYIWIS